MNDNFNRALWEMAKDSPALQEAILKTAKTQSGGYSIPTGNITVSIFEEGKEAQQDPLVHLIKKARGLKVEDLARIMGELKVVLTLKEVQGEELSPVEKTLKDIDITAVAVFALAKWLANVDRERSFRHDYR